MARPPNIPKRKLPTLNKVSPQKNRLAILIAQGSTLHQQRKFNEARANYEQVLKIQPNHFDALQLLGTLSSQTNQFTKAVDYLSRALEINSSHVACYSIRGNALQELKRFDKALESYDRALEINPYDAKVLYNRGNVLQSIGRQEEAMTSYDKAINISPDYAKARWMRVISALPVIQSQTTVIQDCRTSFNEKLLELENWFSYECQDGGENAVGSLHPFFIAYQDLNNKELLSKYGALCCKVMEKWQRKNNYFIKPKSFKKPIRLGIISNHIREHSVWTALTRGWVENINKDNFQLFFFLTSSTVDKETEFAKFISTSFIQRNYNLSEWVNKILSAEIDILLYPEIGMDTMTCKLASLRLAQVQVSSWGHPETTGLPTIDYYLSAKLFEPDNSEEHFSEKLIKLPNLGCYYTKSLQNIESIDLDKFGIKKDKPILICPGTPFKYQPQYDHIFVDIALKLEKCQFIFFVHEKEQLTEMLRNRASSCFLKAGMDLKDFCIFIPWQPKLAFKSLMMQADVYLDTIGFSGFNTAMQAIECNLPLVTSEGRFMRGRLASGILKRLELSELIAKNESHYVSLVVNLIHDQEYNQQVRQLIRINSYLLYDDLEPIKALEQFPENACLASLNS